jgi:hypothetical protein
MAGGRVSVRYIGIITAIYPALMPCSTLPAYSRGNEPSDRLTMGMATRNMTAEATIIRFLPNHSASMPAVSEERIPPSSTAPTMWLICPSE